MKKDTIQETIGKFIYAERKKQKLSLAKLSDIVYGNMGSATRINKIEKGLFKDCSINTIDLILKALGFDLGEIFKIDKNEFLKTINLK